MRKWSPIHTLIVANAANESDMKTGRQETVINPSTHRDQWCDNALQTAIQDVLVKAKIVYFHYCIERLLHFDYGNPNKLKRSKYSSITGPAHKLAGVEVVFVHREPTRRLPC